MASVQPPRCAVLHTPAWPITAAILHEPETFGPTQPLAVFHAQRVLSCSPLAWHEGVRPGQRRRQAQGACPHLVIVPYNSDRDARMYEPVVQSIGTLVPLIDVENPGSLLLATRGPSRYVGGDDALAVRLLALAREGLSHASHGFDVDEVITAGGGLGVGIADGRIAATLAARSSSRRGEPVVIQSGMQATAEFLAPYAVKVLTAVAGCPPDLVDLLERLGLRQLGDIARLSVTDLVGRFGAIGESLHRLASGTDDTPPSTIPPPPDLMMARVFDDPLSQLVLNSICSHNYACDHLKCAAVLNFLKASGDHTGLATPMLLMFICLTCVASSPNVHLSYVLCTPFAELDSAWATICCN